jgi:hypothetical protein
VFRSSRNGPPDLFEKPPDSSADERPLLVSDRNKSPLDWSRDGRFLLFSVADPKTASDLWVLPMAVSPEGRKPFPILQTGFDEMQGQRSSPPTSPSAAQWPRRGLVRDPSTW